MADMKLRELKVKYAALQELLREARDFVENEKYFLHEAYGSRLMHKQQPVIELLARIDTALGDRN